MKIVLNNVQAVKLSQILARVKDRIIQKGKSSLSDHLLVDAVDEFLNQVPFVDIYDDVCIEMEIMEEIHNIEKNN